MDVKCLDTYVLVEISRGNPKFIGYSDIECVVPELILAEFYTVLLREQNEKTADYWFKKFENISSSTNLSILIKAVRFRHENKKKNLSFFDCVGYMFALQNGMKFVTGDKEFEKLVNVEFIKA